jgi:thiamine phosphate synthase YjbQ (UPF0047 family)
MTDSLYALVLIEFDGDTPREQISQITHAIRDRIEENGRNEGVVSVFVQVPALAKSTVAA